MVYILITLGGFISIITTAILKTVTSEKKHKNLKRVLIVFISILIYVLICIYILQQKVA
ncbi:MAG: hypothetical protein WCK78_05925 [Paludibacter sp.]